MEFHYLYTVNKQLGDLLAAVIWHTLLWRNGREKSQVLYYCYQLVINNCYYVYSWL